MQEGHIGSFDPLTSRIDAAAIVASSLPRVVRSHLPQHLTGPKLLLIFLLLFITEGAHAQEGCAQSTDTAQVECLAQKIDVANRALQLAYTASLDKLPDSDPTDKRKSKAQLALSQTAWQTYVEANCNYVGGTEGGSNLWVSNFAGRCQLQEIQARTTFLRKQSGLQRSASDLPSPAQVSPAAASSRPNSAPYATQRVMNLLAIPAAPTPAHPRLPSSFAEWTELQQKAVPAETLAECTTLWAMMNPNESMRVLPAAQDQRDGSKLALEVCVAANLPIDWPEHDAALADIKRILQRSTDLGQPLFLPKNMAQ